VTADACDDPTVSYDLSVWEGELPVDDEAALEMFRLLYGQHIDRHFAEGRTLEPPSPRIAAFAMALLERYPDIDTEAGDDSPWSTAPLLGEGVGPMMHFPMVWSRSKEVSAWAAQLAHDQGLVCFDPQLGQLRP